MLKKVIDGTFSPVLEVLKDLKKGKSGKCSKAVNRKFNHWIYGYVIRRIVVPAQYTSRACPECGYQDRLNGDVFICLRCGYTEDADIVGAKNILMQWTEELLVPLPARPVFIVKG